MSKVMCLKTSKIITFFFLFYNQVSTELFDEICPADCHNRPKTDFKEEDNICNGNNFSKMEGKVQRKKGRKRRHPDALLVENSKLLGSSSDESEASSSRPSSPSSSTG